MTLEESLALVNIARYAEGMTKEEVVTWLQWERRQAMLQKRYILELILGGSNDEFSAIDEMAEWDPSNSVSS
jgi:hypothetical protein